MTLRTRILAFTAVILLCLIGLGGVALQRLDAAQTAMNLTAGDAVPRPRTGDEWGEANRSAYRLVLGLLVLATLVVLAMARSLIRHCRDPVVRLASAMEGIAGGHLDQPVAGQERADEIGGMARALELLRARLREAVRSSGAQRQAEQSKQDGDRLTATLAPVPDPAAMAEALIHSIGEGTRLISRSTEVSRRMVIETGRTDRSLRILAEATQKIGEMARRITDIAGRTNLLALDATIETDAVGDAGQGFAGVAGETKRLAVRVTLATEEFGQQVAAIRGATDLAVEAIRSIASVVAEIDQTALAIAMAVAGQDMLPGARGSIVATDPVSRVADQS